MKTERVALYARVSTFAGQNPEMQLVELREYAVRRGWNVIEEYVDHGVSGAKESRPALNRLMADARHSMSSPFGKLIASGDHSDIW